MNILEILLDKRWILKSEDKEIYYQVRDGLGEVRKFIVEKMGCQVIENPIMVKLEKIPSIPEEHMGIMEFSSQEEYTYLCILLMYLEDKDVGEQFILSQLTEYIQANLQGETADWTVYTNRRRLVKVLKFSVSQGILRITDGAEDAFMDDSKVEVLYENTGASRYFMRSFSKNIMDYEKPSDFQETEYYGVEEDRGFVRSQRVYKRLLFSPGMYKDLGSSEDFEYLKNYGRRLAAELEHLFPCRVHIYRGSAYMMLGEESHMGSIFPGNNGISDILLLCMGEIRNKVLGEEDGWIRGTDETVAVDEIEMYRMIGTVKDRYSKGFTKKYREMPQDEFTKEVLEQMEFWTLIRVNTEQHQIIVYPSAGKLLGKFPEDFIGEKKHEQ